MEDGKTVSPTDMKLSPAGRNTSIQPPHKGYRTIGYADKMWLYVDDAIKKHLEKKNPQDIIKSMNNIKVCHCAECKHWLSGWAI